VDNRRCSTGPAWESSLLAYKDTTDRVQLNDMYSTKVVGKSKPRSETHEHRKVQSRLSGRINWIWFFGGGDNMHGLGKRTLRLILRDD
jgi:hypothetical protein